MTADAERSAAGADTWFDHGLYDAVSDAQAAHVRGHGLVRGCNLYCYQQGFAAGAEWAARPTPRADVGEGAP